MILPPRLPGAKRDPIGSGLLSRNCLSCGKRRDAERIDDVCLWQSQIFAVGGSFVAEDRRKRGGASKGGVQVGFPLHRALCDLIQVAAHSRCLKPDLALVDLVVTVLTQTQQVRQGVFSPLLTENEVVRLQAAVSCATLLAP